MRGSFSLALTLLLFRLDVKMNGAKHRKTLEENLFKVPNDLRLLVGKPKQNDFKHKERATVEMFRSKPFLSVRMAQSKSSCVSVLKT